MSPSELTQSQIAHMVEMFHKFHWDVMPDGNALSPVGSYNMYLGVMNVVTPGSTNMSSTVDD